MKTRTKRRICVAVGMACLFLMICLVGGTERGWAPLSALWWAAACEAVGTAALWKAGWIRWQS